MCKHYIHSIIHHAPVGSTILVRTLRMYKYHHSTKLYRKISRVCCHLYCYECTASNNTDVTMPMATNEWYFFWHSLVLYGDNDFIYEPSISLHVQMQHMWLAVYTWYGFSRDFQYLIQILVWVVEKTQLQGFPIDSHTFAWVRRMIKSSNVKCNFIYTQLNFYCRIRLLGACA